MEYNDYMKMPQSPKVTGFARYIPAVVVVSAFTGFLALAWYAYHSGSQSMKDEDLVVVEAEKTPMKDKPLDPGGMKFPNQDKTIFENFAGNAQNPPKVERVMPQPEEPMAKKIDTTDTTTWVNEKAAAAPAGKEVVMEKSTPKPADQTPKPVLTQLPGKIDNTAPKVADTDIKTFSAPAKSAAPKPVAEPKGTAKIQLGAYRSEKEAKDGFDKLQAKFSELGGKKPIIVKADLGDKGIYYRLRVGGIADAKALCHTLSAKGQACMAVSE